MTPEAHPPIRNLIPHEDPMVCLDRVLTWSPGSTRCEAEVRADSAFVLDGQMESAALIEYMAQSVAACLGYGALRNGEPVRVGMVIACRSMKLSRPFVAIGERLIVEAERQREVDAVSNYATRVLSGDEEIASAQLTLHHASKPPE